jgi:D-alanyl-lipoteichoic acid acyltransferase DltB (MBOAT superfamily)
MKLRNTFIIFIVSGLWHGANWTFIIWGALNALYFLPLMLTNRNRKNLGSISEGRLLPSFNDFLRILLTFSITCLAWVFFRAENLSHAFSYLAGIFSASLFTLPSVISIRMILVLCILIAFVAFEWQHRDREHALQIDAQKLTVFYRYSLYMLLIVCILWIGGNTQDFIYFQF